MSSRRHTTWSVAAVLLLVVGLADAKLHADETDEQRRRQAIVDEVCRDVARLRQLPFKRSVPLKMATPDEVEAFVVEQMDKQWPKQQLRAEERAFKLLGLLPADYDLRKELIGLYRDQIAGFYDPEQDRMTLAARESLKGLTRLMLSHELTHALQDQHFDLDRLLDEGPHTIDRDFAVMCVVEGGATVVMNEYAVTGRVEPSDLLRALFDGESLRGTMRVLGSPRLVQHVLLSPYLYGEGFVNHFRRGGWDHIDRIYSDLPLSAEQVMHPRKYYPRRDFPQRIGLPGLSERLRRRPPIRRWTKQVDTTLGEIGVLALVESWAELFGDQGLRKSATRVASGWDGDRLVSFENAAEETVLYWISTWDTPEDAGEMLDALRKWVSRRADSATDRNRPCKVTLRRPEVKGGPGQDVVCIVLCTRGGRADPAGRIPTYTKRTLRNVRQPAAQD